MSGTQQVDADYEAVLAALTAVGKANAGLESDVVIDADEDEEKAGAPAAATVDPAEDDDEVEDDDEEEDDGALAKAATQFMDASPLVGALIASHDRLAKGQRRLVRELRALRRDQGVMAKAHGLLMSQNRALRDELEAIGNGGAGRRSVVQRPMAKAKPVVDEAHPNDGLFGPDLIAKATSAALAGDGLSALELSIITEYAGMGATLGNIRDSDPQLASRFDAAVAALKS
mgnify:CR=1 FL=1